VKRKRPLRFPKLDDVEATDDQELVTESSRKKINLKENSYDVIWKFDDIVFRQWKKFKFYQ
jgi:hypothetical protein